MKITRGPTQGVGATQQWESKEGNGKLVFTEVDPEKGVKYDLFFDGFPKSTAAFHYKPMGDKTEVTWTMNGEIEFPIVGGYFAFGFKNLVSNSFISGLENLNKLLNGKEVE